MTEVKWFIARDGQQHGPYPTEQMRQMLADGQLLPGDVVWRSGMTNWVPVMSVPELSDPASPGIGEPRGWPGAAPVLEYPSAAGRLSYAGFWFRFAALIIDGLIIAVPLISLILLLPIDHSALGDTLTGNQALDVMLGLGISLLYFVGFEASRFQATPGKMALRLKVVDETGQRAGAGRILLRWFGKNVLTSIPAAGTLLLIVMAIMVGVTAEKTGLHDLMGRTRVIRK